MDKNMYFIPLLARAFESRDPRQALPEALAEIVQLGRSPDYATGFTQFRAFMRIAAATLKEFEAEVRVAQLIEQLDTGEDEADVTLARLALRSTSHVRYLYERYLASQAESAPADVHPTVGVEVLRNDAEIGFIPLNTRPEASELRGLMPGTYQILSTGGQLLFDGKLSAGDLLLSGAAPGTPLRLAAATEGHEASPSRTIKLLNGVIEVRIYAGINAGRMRISFDRGMGG